MADLPELERRVERYRRNRDHLLRVLPAAGLTRMAPADGAFYLYLDISEFAADSVQLCRRLLDETGVALTPGVDFDPERGHHFVRLSFAGPEAEVAAAADRLAALAAAARSGTGRAPGRAGPGSRLTQSLRRALSGPSDSTSPAAAAGPRPRR